jgi:hypothetical protein
MIVNLKHVFPLLLASLLAGMAFGAEPTYQGKWVQGVGDDRSLELIDKAFDSIGVSAEMANLAMFYKRDWDGLVLSNTAWPGWWVQNTYGGSYGMMPFLEEPYATWMKNAQALWFREMADGKRPDANGYVAPDGSLCDATLIYRNGGRDLGFGHFGWPHSTDPINDGQTKMKATYYRQGDAGHQSNDWGIGFTAAGLVMECERLLVSRDLEATRRQLPQLKRVAAFLDSRRDSKTNLLKGGKGANLLAPAFHGHVDADGRSQLAYLTELSVNYCAALVRLTEVCGMVGEKQEANGYRTTADKVRAALPSMMDDQGSFIMFQDPEGVRHGVFGAEEHGYFEATPNHDAVCMTVVDDAAAKRIIQRMVSIKELAPHDLIITNYPAYDESGYPTGGLMTYGTWVHGGHWSTCQGRMNVACLRVNEFDHPFRSWDRMCKLMQNFRADAPMGNFGESPWGSQLGSPHNTVIDNWGVPAGLIRGLFEYNYRADGLRVRPHLPPGITRYIQKKAVVFGGTKVYLTVTGNGKVASAKANGQDCPVDADGWLDLKGLKQNSVVAVEIVCGKAKPQGAWKPHKKGPLVFPNDPGFWAIPEHLENKYHVDLAKLKRFHEETYKAGLQDTYEAAMARTALELLLGRYERSRMRQAGTLPEPDIAPVPPCNQNAVDQFYLITARNIAGGLTDRMAGLTIWDHAKPDPRAVEIARRVNLFPKMRNSADFAYRLIPYNNHDTKVGAAQGSSDVFPGEVARVSIFKKAMTDAEIATLASGRDALSETDATCIYTGKPEMGSALPIKPGWTSKSELTVEVWVKPVGHGRILDKITVGGGDGFLIDIVGANQIRTIIGPRVEGHSEGQNSVIELNQWVHVALVLNTALKNAVVYIHGKRAYEMQDLPVSY